MERPKMERARDMARELAARIDEALEAEDPDYVPHIPTMYTASVRRASMELSRLLSRMRGR